MACREIELGKVKLFCVAVLMSSGQHTDRPLQLKARRVLQRRVISVHSVFLLCRKNVRSTGVL